MKRTATKQQKEALTYFGKYAGDWDRKARTTKQSEVNVIAERNDFVLKVVSERKRVRSALDVGCGTGDLVRALAKEGVRAVGVDFAKEMIETATEHAKSERLPLARFEQASIFDYTAPAGAFDSISANGFIEYISYAELERFLSLASEWLFPGGSLVLGSRNRLFNLFSLNAFTEEELKGGNAPMLLAEALAIARAKSIADISDVGTVPLQKEGTKHTGTGIGVATRYQFTPVQLITILRKHGFEAMELFPIHIHGAPPSFKEAYPEAHGTIANLLQNYAGETMSLLPQSSSFMIHAKKK
ncbi:MAG: methyltransferase domain-containing protein [bacterium]|nr:methyltransferase domain-containing protein [bacterium]